MCLDSSSVIRSLCNEGPGFPVRIDAFFAAVFCSLLKLIARGLTFQCFAMCSVDTPLPSADRSGTVCLFRPADASSISFAAFCSTVIDAVRFGSSFLPAGVVVASTMSSSKFSPSTDLILLVTAVPTLSCMALDLRMDLALRSRSVFTWVLRSSGLLDGAPTGNLNPRFLRRCLFSLCFKFRSFCASVIPSVFTRAPHVLLVATNSGPWLLGETVSTMTAACGMEHCGWWHGTKPPIMDSDLMTDGESLGTSIPGDEYPQCLLSVSLGTDISELEGPSPSNPRIPNSCTSVAQAMLHMTSAIKASQHILVGTVGRTVCVVLARVQLP